MSPDGAAVALLFPVGLGLLGFVEPCSIGSSVLFPRYVDGQPAARQFTQTAVFAVTRAGLMGGLGTLAALVGSAVLDVQRAGWIGLGALYVVLGVMYATGTVGVLMRRIGPAPGSHRSRSSDWLCRCRSC